MHGTDSLLDLIVGKRPLHSFRNPVTSFAGVIRSEGLTLVW
jgi:hypothetical protein